MHNRRRAAFLLLGSLALAVALTVTGVLLGTSPQRMVVWMLGSLAILAVGLWAYGHFSRDRPHRRQRP
ncbi:hypothetical protein BH11ACT4_BH11ACT4_05060 [soil metagenome]